MSLELVGGQLGDARNQGNNCETIASDDESYDDDNDDEVVDC